MRILHTSDWHLGASLEGVSRDRDHALFLDWLEGAIVEHDVDVLVIAGDVFDHAHPSAEAQRLYYRFLRKLLDGRLKKAVVVGGNHDSASRLDAPREVLESLDVHVVGGLLGDEGSWDRCLCPIRLDGKAVDAVVLAVPFVHEYRLGVRPTLTNGPELAAQLRDRFTTFYRTLVDRAQALYDGAPIVATGHLTCVGAEKGDAPADIHMVGSIGALPAEIFDPRLQYVALGHIHRAYRVGSSRAWYSGSPIPLSLKEAGTARGVKLVELASDPTGAAAVKTLEVPFHRHVLELAGTESEVADRLTELHWDTPLPPIVYARVFVDHYKSSVEEQLRKVALARGEEGPLLVQVRQSLNRAPESAAEVTPPVRLDDLTPEEVFLRLCAEREEPVDDRLLTAFRSLLTDRDEKARGIA